MEALLATVTRVWGFRSLRPLQERAIAAVLADRDSLVVMPTGGGKSLCYQAPAVHRGGTTVVVSPLIALMKDQVDALNRNGVPAVRLDSSLDSGGRNAAEAAVRAGIAPLVFISPERLAQPGYAHFLHGPRGVHAVAIDEAHCISHWGHDFRPEYRQLLRIREHFPTASVHGYTATATEKVRADIVAQLGLRDPELLVGNFDRPNLTYRVLPRLNLAEQVQEVIARHANSAGIVYCLRRRDVDDLAAALKNAGVDAIPYHAGMDPETRRTAQDRFAKEDAPVVCATIAFGMGIDRPDVRFVVHGAMPKSIEHYQQETGRAGRDGAPAECVLYFSGGDAITLKRIVQKTAEESGETSHLPAVFEQLNAMDRYCRSATCRHRSLVNHFGQAYEAPGCGACDVCLGDTDTVPDATVVAQKILSCVYRVNQSFGAGHVCAVLRGENTDAVRTRGHDKLSTFGLLKGTPKPTLRDWVFQLVGQDVLIQTRDEFPVLKLNAASWEVMGGKRPVTLIQLARPERRGAASVPVQSTVPNEALFEKLRVLRKGLAAKENVPAYRVFPDSVLSAFATTRPTTPDAIRAVTGVGDKKFQAYGEAFLAAIREFDLENPLPRVPAGRPLSNSVSPRKQLAFDLFKDKAAVEDVMHQVGVARSTTSDYLAEFVERNAPTDVQTWVPDVVVNRVRDVLKEVGDERLKPIFEKLNGEVPYDQIRVVVAFLRNSLPLPRGERGAG
jgi:ATP-dependent DNA helicase RecQ